MKKTIIVSLILIVGALSFFIYLAVNKKSAAPLVGEINTTDKKTEAVSAKSPPGFKKEPLSPEKEIKEIVTDKEGVGKTSEETVVKEEPVMEVEHNLEDVRVQEEIKEKVEKPTAIIAEAPPVEFKRTGEVKPVEQEIDKPAGKKEEILVETTSVKAEKIAGAAKDEKDITKPVDKPALVPAEIPLPIIKDENKAVEFQRTGEVKPVEKEIEKPAGKKEEILAETTSVKAEKIAKAVKDETDITKPVDKPALVPAETPLLIIKDENKAAMIGDEIKQPIIKMEAAVEGPRVVEEKKETMPAGGLIIMPQETPAPALIGLSSMGTQDIIPERENEQPLVKMEAAVTGSRPEKAIETKEVIPTAGEKEEYMEKPEPFSTEMLKKENNNRVAIFPFENLSDNKDAFKHVLPLLIDKLGEKGFEVVNEDDLSRFLCKERIRSSGYISRELSGKIRKRFNISAILTGAIISFSTGEIPQFGVLARMIDPSDGTILWADYSAATGEDFIAILELGRLKTVFSLIPKVIDTLFVSFKVEEFYTEIKPAHRIAIMPFKNNTNYNNAGIIATYMFMVELLKSRELMPVEYGDIRDMIIKLGIRRKGDIGYDSIGELSKAFKARGIVVGVVDNYSDGEAVSAAPNVGITARLVDGSTNEILWYNSYQLSGEDNIVALDWGRIRSVHSVAYKAVSSLVKEMSKKKWRE